MTSLQVPDTVRALVRATGAARAAHEWNTLRAGPDDWKLVDPDGVLAEPERDLGVLIREDADELLTADPADRARALAARTDTDPPAILDWGDLELVSNGLLGLETGLAGNGRVSLAAADRIAGLRAGGSG